MKRKCPLDNLYKIVNPCFDPVFKSIFTRDEPESKQALRGLVSAILQKDLQVADVTINEPPVNGIGDKQIRYDLSCVLDDGEKANVEMTLWPKVHEVNKMEYFLARLHATQRTKYPAASSGVFCSPDVVALRGLIPFNRAKGRGIKPLRHE
ncbi:MAG: Rpn family recombination-promoting nuclease/putative transposase [Spirochaetaceae bacterium]|nr:Rpn family recombination-promoting nuclease/putative transposase [Spirochaetaceae bacterium]